MLYLRAILSCAVNVFFVAALSISHKPIELDDNTPMGVVVPGNVLEHVPLVASNSPDDTFTYALLKSKVSNYFRIDERTGRLMTRRAVDRDTLCMESGLCCTKMAQSFQGSQLSSVRSVNLGTVCTLRLDVAITDGRKNGSVPSTHQVLIEIKDENDHAPVFEVERQPSKETQYLSNRYPDTSRMQTPIVLLNISEAAQVRSHRLHLPLATDLDATPFNVQRYVIEAGGGGHGHFPAAKFFDLDVQKREISSASNFEDGNSITALDLLLVAQLDREKLSSFELRVLAIDGGSPVPLTGTLSVRIQVTDANDHEPIFERSNYETTVDEGHFREDEVILRVVASDQDEGDNAKVHYSWFRDQERFGLDTNLLGTVLTEEAIETAFGSPVSPERLAQLQDLPNYWFRLNEWTGEIFLFRPLDYETRGGFVFRVIAENPVGTDRSGTGRGDGTSTAKTAQTSQSLTTVTIKVVNHNDEDPQISVDYVSNSDSVKHRQVKENTPPEHFIALIRVTDADADPPPKFLSSSSGGLGSSIYESQQPSIAGDHVACELVNHAENYSLVEKTQPGSLTEGNEYILKTRTPLDREREQRHFVVIQCYDNGSPARTSTATVEVEILDENDCAPQVFVSARIPTHVRSNQLSPVLPLPRSRISEILQTSLPDWPAQQRTPYFEHPILAAYEAGIPVVLVSIPENQPPGTIVASLRGVDADAGDNGRVSFQVLKEEIRVPRVVVGHRPGLERSPGRYPEAEIDHNLPPVLLHSDNTSLTLFRLEPNGDVITSRTIDREQDSSTQNELYFFVDAHDRGHPIALTSYVLLAVAILDENDNRPVFKIPQLTFSVLENESAPKRIGEIEVFDTDATGTAHSEGFQDARFFHGPSMLRVSNPPQHRLSVIINPGHGLTDLPFIIDSTADGRFFLNVTRPLDREAEEVFRFNVQASDYAGPSHVRHTVTAMVTVSVVDVNDNAPEIIFPKPSVATAHIHPISYKEMPDAEILRVNANDKDSGEENGKFLFELGAPLSTCPTADPTKLAKTALDADLFRLDAVKGLLKVQRRMTEADLGEHWLQLVVRDLGKHSQETRQIIRLRVDRSPPQFSSGVRPWIAAAPQPGPPSWEHSVKGDEASFNRQLPDDWSSADRSISDVALVVVISLMIAGFVVLIGLFVYLKNRHKLFCCFPGVCLLFQRRHPVASSHHPYSSPKYPSKSACSEPRGPMQESTFPGSVLGSPQTFNTPLSFGEWGVSESKYHFQPPQAAGAYVSLAGAGPRYQSKIGTDYYHEGTPRSPTPLSSRIVSNPLATLKHITPLSDELCGAQSHFYNPTRVVHPTAISSTLGPSVIGSPCRYARTGPGILQPFCVSRSDFLYPPPSQPLMSAQPRGVHAISSLQPSYGPFIPADAYNPTTDAPPQINTNTTTVAGTSDPLRLQQLANKFTRYKSEPTLAACDSLLEDGDEEDGDELEVPITSTTTTTTTTPCDHQAAFAWSSQEKGHRLPSDGGSHQVRESTRTRDRRIGTLPMPPEIEVENYAVTFPKPQASYV